MLDLSPFEEDCLDQAVHDVCSAIASDTNNQGRDAQVKFLHEHGWTEAQIYQAAVNATPGFVGAGAQG